MVLRWCQAHRLRPAICAVPQPTTALAPSAEAAANLRREGIADKDVAVVGSTSIDAARRFVRPARGRPIVEAVCAALGRNDDAVEAYKIADLLKKEGICAAMWADWWGFKMESYDGIRENAALVQNAGACAIIHSDDENGIQRLNQEAAKAQGDARRAGIVIPDAEVIRWLTLNAAKAIGVDQQTGSLDAGKMGDVVLWNANPLSTYARPEKVWIDGALLYDADNPKLRPVSDFELGMPGEGDVK